MSPVAARVAVLAPRASAAAADCPHLQSPYAELDATALLAHFRSRRGVQFFPVPDADESRREKIDAILADRFEFNGEIHELQAPIHWSKNPSVDVEWHILLHKFYFAVGLGMAYAETRDPRYLDKWIELTCSWMDSTPPGFIAADVTGRRVQNWIYAYWYFVTESPDAPVPPRFHARLLASIEQQVNYLRANLTPKRNHRTLELYAVFLAGVVFPEFKDAATWRALGITELARNAESDLLADGVHCELSTDYHHLVLKNYLCMRRLAAANDIDVPASFDARLVKALEFSMHVHKPDGIVPSFSDGDARSFLDLLATGAELYDREDFRYVATGGHAGVAPHSTAAGFAQAGYHVVRSGWGGGARAFADEHHLVFDCGPLGEGNHGHFDCLSFELAANGRSLIADPGRYTYSEVGAINWRARFRGSSYHNTVTVDGRNQTRYEPRRVADASRHVMNSVRHRVTGLAPQAELEATVSRRRFAYLCGSAKSREYEASHQRRIVFAFDEYWLIVDRLTAREAHRYDLWFHLTETAQDAVTLERDRGSIRVLAPGLVAAFDASAIDALTVEPGFVSYRYGVKHAAPILHASREARSTWFHSLLMPDDGAAPRPFVRVLPLIAVDATAQAASTARVTAFEVTRSEDASPLRDIFFFGEPDCGAWRGDRFGFAGSCLALRLDASGNVCELRGTADACLCCNVDSVSLESSHA